MSEPAHIIAATNEARARALTGRPRTATSDLRFLIREAIVEALPFFHRAAGEDDNDAAADAVLRVLGDHPGLPTSAGHYYSTHCLHEHHDQCKAECKHCASPCQCNCHTPDGRS